MSNTPNYDAKVKIILDALAPGEMVCELTGRRWVMSDEEIKWYRHFNVPPSKRAPLTRMEINTSFYRCNQWWNHKHPVTGKNIVSFVHPATGIHVLPDLEWHTQDFSSINAEFDPSKPFFEQIRSLQLRVPFPAAANVKEPENSVAMLSFGDRNSYFVLGTESEDSLYSVWAQELRSSAEVNNADNVSESYNVNNAKNVHNSRYVRDSIDVINSSFVFFCDDIEFCFGATNQSHKKYIFFNKQLTEGEYKAEMAKIDLSRRDQLQAYVARFRDLVGNKTIWPENLCNQVINTTGEYNYESHDLSQCYSCTSNCANLFWCAHGVDGSMSAFASPIYSSECYMANNALNCQSVKFCESTFRSRGLEYCFLVYDCEDCFGCVGLRHKKFHIFNKPYEEEDYWKRIDEIKCAMLDRGEYGNFFPLSMSTSYFPDGGAVAYYGADPASGPTLGWAAFEPESHGAIGDLGQIAEMRKRSDIPNSVADLTDDWAGKPIYDEIAKRRFAFLKPEIDFYKRHNIAPPDMHFVRRMVELMLEANLGVLEEQSCAKCGKKIQVAKNLTYPNRTVYCMDDYRTWIEANI